MTENKQIIGYRFRIKFDNGDINEWYRETYIVSPIYKTKDLTLKSFELYLYKVKDDIKQNYHAYFEFQKEFEKDEKLFRERCIKGRDKEIEQTIELYRSHVSIIEEYLYSDATITDTIIKFNVAD